MDMLSLNSLNLLNIYYMTSIGLTKNKLQTLHLGNSYFMEILYINY